MAKAAGLAGSQGKGEGNMLKPPEMYAGGEVVAAVKVADDPTEIPNKYIIITHSGPGFATHQIAFNGVEWVGTNGRYDMPWHRALDNMLERVRMFAAPARKSKGVR